MDCDKYGNIDLIIGNLGVGKIETLSTTLQFLFHKLKNHSDMQS